MANLCQDIVLNIILRLPVKSILRFRCVSKAWCKLLKDPGFVQSHLNHAIEKNRFNIMMLTFYGRSYGLDEDTNFYNLVYDPSSSTISDRAHINHPLGHEGPRIQIWGSCNGLICGSPKDKYNVFLWNPATNEFKELPFPIELLSELFFCKYAIGYDDRTDDYKVVSLVGFDCDFSKYQVYTLKSNSWRSLEDMPNYDKLRAGGPEMQVSVNGATHWLTSGGYEPGNDILSFDFKDERFNTILVPSCSDVYPETNLCSLGGSLCLHGSIGGRNDVWEMKEYGVTESWVKLLTFNQDTTRLDPLQFVKNGEVLLGYHTDVGYHLDLYDIKCGTSNRKSLSKRDSWRAITFVYVESLVTLDCCTTRVDRRRQRRAGEYLLL